MKLEILNLIVTFVLAVAYLACSLKILIIYFEKISRPVSHASAILYISSIIGFGIVFYNITDVASNAFQFYYAKNQFSKGLYYWFLFSVLALITSFISFLLSFYLIKFVTKQNENAELARNNYHVAGIHSAVIILICLILSAPVANIASIMVDFSQFPN